MGSSLQSEFQIGDWIERIDCHCVGICIKHSGELRVVLVFAGDCDGANVGKVEPLPSDLHHNWTKVYQPTE